MKVLLVQSYLGRREIPIYPIGLTSIASSLRRRGIEARLFDPNLSSDPYGDLERALREGPYDAVGISLRSIDTTIFFDPFLHYLAFKECIRRVKALLPETPLICGGTGFSMFSNPVMERNPEIDFGILLEGEETFPALLENLKSPEVVPGVLFRKDGRIRRTGGSFMVDLDRIDLPSRDLTPVKPYQVFYNTIGVESKRGCPMKCIYCSYPELGGGGMRLRSPDYVVEELTLLKEKYGVKEVFFTDPIFNLPREHSLSICESILKRGLRIGWSAYFNERSMDREFMETAFRAGCTLFSFSPDAFSDETLTVMKKGLSREDILKVADLAGKIDGVRVSFNFIVNPPGESLKNFFGWLTFSLKSKALLGPRLTGIWTGYLRVEPGTEMFRIAKEEEMIRSEDELLPESAGELRRLFYHNPGTPYIDTLFKFYFTLKRIRQRIVKPPLPPWFEPGAS